MNSQANLQKQLKEEEYQRQNPKLPRVENSEIVVLSQSTDHPRRRRRIWASDSSDDDLELKSKCTDSVYLQFDPAWNLQVNLGDWTVKISPLSQKCTESSMKHVHHKLGSNVFLKEYLHNLWKSIHHRKGQDAWIVRIAIATALCNRMVPMHSCQMVKNPKQGNVLLGNALIDEGRNLGIVYSSKHGTQPLTCMGHCMLQTRIYVMSQWNLCPFQMMRGQKVGSQWTKLRFWVDLLFAWAVPKAKLLSMYKAEAKLILEDWQTFVLAWTSQTSWPKK